MKRKLVMGCIADDFTGASDAASFLQKSGLKTILYNGIPQMDCLEDFDAVVIALKTRTSPVAEAVQESLNALDWLRQAGAKQLYIKYCSTFDSTQKGNIGPIVDAAMEKYDIPYTLLCPSLPVNGRTVKNGRLYVNGVPLHETHMKNHPLTPMWDDRIEELMKSQGKYACMTLSLEELSKGREYIIKRVEAFGQDKIHFYIIPDYYEEEHKEIIYEIFCDLPLLTGGSGILSSSQLGEETGQKVRKCRTSRGKTILFAGSCSKITLEQIEEFRRRDYPLIKIDPMALLYNEISVEDIWNMIGGQHRVLVYSADTAENVREIQKFGKEKVANLIENTISDLARKSVDNGYTQIIVAGGETSGAVTRSLGYNSYIIGESVAPGVPMMIPVNDENIRLVLKSGNFGAPDFFEQAVVLTERDWDGE